MLLGLVSDIHCNAAALRTVLARLRPAVDEILIAGDAIYEYRFSDEVISMVREAEARFVLGNHEVEFLRSRPRGSGGSADPDNVAFVASTPTRIETVIGGKKLLMVHGVPWPPYSDYLYHSSPELSRFADEVEADIVILGHTHVPMVERVGGRLLVNPGSAGEFRGAGGYLSYAVLDTSTEEVALYRFTVDPDEHRRIDLPD